MRLNLLNYVIKLKRLREKKVTHVKKYVKKILGLGLDALDEQAMGASPCPSPSKLWL